MSKRLYNFSAGPAVLPEEVLRAAQTAIWDLNNSGVGVLEHSHRGPEFTAVMADAEARCRALASIPDEYAVLFLQGGASLQFCMVPMNLLSADTAADYVNTGAWSKKAIAEAERLGRVHIAGSSADDRFRHIPSNESLRWSNGPAYAHYTSNNTIAGTQWRTPPTPPAGVPLVVDASSDIFSRPIDVGAHGLIYAGAQKNLGPSGLTLVILRKELAERCPRSLPTMLQYRTHIEDGSMFNTPPTFAVYVLGQVLAWLERFGGLPAIEEYNAAKAAVLYDYLDESSLFWGTAQPDSRSNMNVCFRAGASADAPDPAAEAEFLAEAKAAGLVGLKGHRSVGGMRASIYNAFPVEGCRALVDKMKAFEQRRG